MRDAPKLEDRDVVHRRILRLPSRRTAESAEAWEARCSAVIDESIDAWGASELGETVLITGAPWMSGSATRICVLVAKTGRRVALEAYLGHLPSELHAIRSQVEELIGAGCSELVIRLTPATVRGVRPADVQAFWDAVQDAQLSLRIIADADLGIELWQSILGRRWISGLVDIHVNKRTG